MSKSAPAEIEDLARRRSAARAAGDFGTADQLRSQIEAAGWKVVDRGHDFRLEPAHPPDRDIDGLRVHGASATVPSRLAEPSGTGATVVLVVGTQPDLALRSAEELAGVEPAPQVVVVAPDSVTERRDVLGGLDQPAELVWMTSSVNLAGRWSAGIRRAIGAVIVLCGADTRLPPEVLSAVASALEDPGVAVVGASGLYSNDMRRWLPTDGPDADAVDADLLGFRREDLARASLDERFMTPRLLATWWSLTLRDPGSDQPPRRALVLPLDVEEPPLAASAERPDRAERRDFYRLLGDFGGRSDLLRQPVMPTAEGGPGRRR